MDRRLEFCASGLCFPATDDAFVDAAEREIEFGLEPRLEVANVEDRYRAIYVRFSLTDVARHWPAGRAWLLLRIVRVDREGDRPLLPLEIERTTANWDEGDITAEDQPDGVQTLRRITEHPPREADLMIDVTAGISSALIQESTAVSFAIRPGGAGGAWEFTSLNDHVTPGAAPVLALVP